MKTFEEALKEIEEDWTCDAEAEGPGGQDIMKLLKVVRVLREACERIDGGKDGRFNARKALTKAEAIMGGGE